MPLGARKSRTQDLKDSQRFSKIHKDSCVGEVRGGAGWTVEIKAGKKIIFLFEIVQVEINNNYYYINIISLLLKLLLLNLPYIRYNALCFHMFFIEFS